MQFNRGEGSLARVSEVSFSNEVSYEWQRRSLLRKWQNKEISKEEICDADFILTTSARYHGWLAETPCPICARADLYLMHWVHGENLGWRSGSARSRAEIARLVNEHGPITVHLVEVCVHCGWNYVRTAYTAVAA
ncbi:hypothetical protein CCASP_08290 [Corynebacterium caspium DSM 44850]|nr:hypothetical protein CCASP_08290 [Corynebacterium caspium DSM 44850]